MQAFRTQIIKINSANLRNSCKRLSADAVSSRPPSAAKPVEVSSVIPELGNQAGATTVSSSPPPPQQQAEESKASAVGGGIAVLESATNAAINVAARYNVVAERTFGGFSKPLSIAELNHKVNDQQHLQPSKMRAFCSAPDKDQVIQFPRIIETQNASVFAESKTRANLTLPLKPVKLASPFPEPVKVMMSHTTSDEEKAQQMLAESKIQKTSDCGRSPTTPFSSRNYSTMNIVNRLLMKQPATATIRYYTSTTRPLFADNESADQSGKCKKLVESAGKPACPRYQLGNCPKKARESCEEGQQDVVCTKQESPYPAYSEFCHEDVIEKPTECKMCPWPTEKHPSFKPPKRKLHVTRTPTMSRHTGLERLADRVEAAKAEAAVTMDEAPGGDVRRTVGDPPKTLDDDGGMQCDLRKPECKRPERRPCAEKKKEKPKEEEKKKKPPKKKCADAAKAEEDSAAENSFDGIIADRHQGLIDAGLAEPVRIEAAKKKPGESKKGKCTKLPFLPFDSPKRTPREPRTVGGCPKKPKKPLVIDCPPDDDVAKCSGNEAAPLKNAVVDPPAAPPLTVGPPKLYRMEYIMKKDKKKDEKKCPKIDLNMQRPEEEDEDPCKIPKVNTKECPSDLLPIRRRIKRPPPRNKKASSNDATPVDLTPETTHQHQQPKM